MAAFRKLNKKENNILQNTQKNPRKLFPKSLKNVTEMDRFYKEILAGWQNLYLKLILFQGFCRKVIFLEMKD